MYSGTIFRKKSGRLMGVHQKIDRVARKHITEVVPAWCKFPSSLEILHFEGLNGPDGIKRKSPAIDEPWHFIDPTDTGDVLLLDVIDQHIENMAKALMNNNQQRAAFEAAWLSHAITDGLTPPHHFPFEKKLMELRNGQGLDSRNSILKKSLMPGNTKFDMLRNNWHFWGAKGLMTMHAGFEAGVATAIPYQRFLTGMPTEGDMAQVRSEGFRTYYLGAVHRVVDMNMYEKFAKNGWTSSLARQTNKELMPLIIRAVVLGWMSAIWLAESRQ